MVDRPKQYGNIYWLSDEAYNRAVTQFRLQVGGVLSPLRLYGQSAFVDEALEVIVKLTEDFGLRVRGVDHPVDFIQVARSNGYRIPEINDNKE